MISGKAAMDGGGVVSAIGSGPLSSGTTDYKGACWGGGPVHSDKVLSCLGMTEARRLEGRCMARELEVR